MARVKGQRDTEVLVVVGVARNPLLVAVHFEHRPTLAHSPRAVSSAISPVTHAAIESMVRAAVALPVDAYEGHFDCKERSNTKTQNTFEFYDIIKVNAVLDLANLPSL